MWLYIGSAGESHPRRETLVSSDGGAHLARQRAALPGALYCTVTATSRAVLWTLCGGGMMMTEWRSTDGGRSFHEVNLQELPGTGGAMVEVANSSVAYVYKGLAAARLLVTINGGRSFRTAGRFPLPKTIGGDMVFTSAERGLTIRSGVRSDRALLERTTDSGRHWTRVALPTSSSG